MIVKVQMSMGSSDGASRVLVYNEDRTFLYQGGASSLGAALEKKMNERAKAYFEAHWDGRVPLIAEEVESQDW
jgi:hypothetical protein